MNIDFLNNNCRENPRNDICFGLCDKEDGTPAYSDSTTPDTWVAIVKNPNAIEVTFVPIDKCLISDNEYEGMGRCDGLLFSDWHLFFVELKDKKKGGSAEAIPQLESTIQLFMKNHDISTFKYKKAFVCNKQHKHFQIIDNELNLKFFRQYGVRLDIQAEILIIHGI